MCTKAQTKRNFTCSWKIPRLKCSTQVELLIAPTRNTTGLYVVRKGTLPRISTKKASFRKYATAQVIKETEFNISCYAEPSNLMTSHCNEYKVKKNFCNGDVCENGALNIYSLKALMSLSATVCQSTGKARMTLTVVTWVLDTISHKCPIRAQLPVALRSTKFNFTLLSPSFQSRKLLGSTKLPASTCTMLDSCSPTMPQTHTPTDDESVAKL